MDGKRGIVGPEDFLIRTDQNDAFGQPHYDLLELPVIAARLLQGLVSLLRRGRCCKGPTVLRRVPLPA
jgi:hypothetical protein